jgi:hypothetical protein
VNVPKAARANFSHAFGAKVKKIIRKNLAARQLAEGIGFSEDDVN